MVERTAATAVEQTLELSAFALTFGVTALSLWKGGRPEHVAVLGNLLAVFVTPFVQPPHDASLPYLPVAAVDASVLILLIALLLSTGGQRLWLFAASACQLLTVLVHVGVLLDLDILARGYIAALLTPYFLLLSAFAAGVLEAQWRGDAHPIWRPRRTPTRPEES